jgi:DNA-binding NtrC family response regulator
MVVVRLPAHRVIAAIKPAAPPRPGRIALVVDDDASVRDTAALLLEDKGWAVIKAGNANEAFAELQREPGIDLLFTDVFMPPGMSGTELASCALRLRPDLRVLLTSGFDGNVTEYADGSGRLHAIIHKPYRATELTAAIASLCGTAREDAGLRDAARELAPIQCSA